MSDLAPNAPRDAIDTTQHLSVAQLRELKARGVNTVFRYFAGGGDWKCLNAQDVRNFREAGMNMTLIYEGAGDKAGSFSAQQGYEDAKRAVARARELGLPDNAAVYFAVDFDANNQQIGERILPYFQGIQRALHEPDPRTHQPSNLRVGVYGSGAVCQRVHDAGLAQRTWLAGSSGWNGTQEFFRSGKWDVLQHIVREGGVERDYDTINPLTHGIGSFNPGQAYAQAMGEGASSVTPETAAHNLRSWLMSAPANGQDDGDNATRDEFYNTAQRQLGMTREDVNNTLNSEGPIAMLLIFFMFLIVGATKMGAIGSTGSAIDPTTHQPMPNQPPPTSEVPNPFFTDNRPPLPAASTTPPVMDAGMADALGLTTDNLTQIQRMVRDGIRVDLAGAGGSNAPDGKFDRNDVSAMAGLLAQSGVTMRSNAPSSVVDTYFQHFFVPVATPPAPPPATVPVPAR